MAVSVATITLNGYPKGSDNTRTNQKLRGTITFSAGTYPVGGYPLNWSAVEALKSIYTIPTDADFKSVANPPSGLTYMWDNVVGNLHIFVQAGGGSTYSGPLVEFGGTLPGWMQADTVAFTVVFPRSN